MKLKVTIIGEDYGYWTIEDYSYFHQDVCDDIGEEKAKEYFKEGRFTEKEVNQNNGKHFLFGHMESLEQSDECPLILWRKKPIAYLVEKVEN